MILNNLKNIFTCMIEDFKINTSLVLHNMSDNFILVENSENQRTLTNDSLLFFRYIIVYLETN